MTCPKCQSDDWKLASLVHREGLTHVAIASKGVGMGVGGGGVGIGVGGGKTEGIHQTEASKLAAPPSGFLASGGFMVGVLVSGILALFSGWWLLLTVACLVGLMITWSSDAEAHQVAMASWADVRMCQRCGTFYKLPTQIA